MFERIGKWWYIWADIKHIEWREACFKTNDIHNQSDDEQSEKTILALNNPQTGNLPFGPTSGYSPRQSFPVVNHRLNINHNQIDKDIIGIKHDHKPAKQPVKGQKRIRLLLPFDSWELNSTKPYTSASTKLKRKSIPLISGIDIVKRPCFISSDRVKQR